MSNETDLREAVERLAEEWAGRHSLVMTGDSVAHDLRALLAEHLAIPAEEERECRYPCDCGQFSEEHCACMDGHESAEVDAHPETCPSLCVERSHPGREHNPATDGCYCWELCAMGPTCPGANAGLPGAGCWRTEQVEALAEVLVASWTKQGGLTPPFGTDRDDARKDARDLLASDAFRALVAGERAAALREAAKFLRGQGVDALH